MEFSYLHGGVVPLLGIMDTNTKRSGQKGRPAKAPRKTTVVSKQKATGVANSQSNRKNGSHRVTSLSAGVKRAVQNICGLTDPFCQHARGTKYPDASAIRTLAFTYEQLSTWSVDAAGTTAALCYPQWNYAAVAPSALRAGSSVTAWGTFSADAKFGSNIVQSYRIISAGMRFQVIAAPLNLSGAIHIRHYGQESLADISVIDMLSMNPSARLDLPLRDCDDLVVLFQRTSQEPTVFYPVADDNAVPPSCTTHGFCPLTVYIDGAAANSSVVQVSVVIHYELIFTDGTSNNVLATHPPPANSLITTAASYVTSTIRPVAEAGVTAFGNYVATKAEAAILRYLAPPSASLAMLAL